MSVENSSRNKKKDSTGAYTGWGILFVIIVISINQWWWIIGLMMICGAVLIVVLEVNKRRQHWAKFRKLIFPSTRFFDVRSDFFSTWREDLERLDDDELATGAAAAAERDIAYWFHKELAEATRNPDAVFGARQHLNLLPAGTLPGKVEDGIRTLGMYHGVVGHAINKKIDNRPRFIAAVEVVANFFLNKHRAQVEAYEEAMAFISQDDETLFRINNGPLATRTCAALESILPVHFHLVKPGSNIGPLLRDLKAQYPQWRSNFLFKKFISAIEDLADSRGGAAHKKMFSATYVPVDEDDLAGEKEKFIHQLKRIAACVSDDSAKAEEAYNNWYPGFFGGLEALEPGTKSTAFLLVAIPLFFTVASSFWSTPSIKAPNARAPSEKTKIEKKESGQQRQVVNKEPKQVATSPGLAADIQSARPFINEVLSKIRCKPDDVWKRLDLFGNFSAPESYRNTWSGPWADRAFPPGTCLEPTSVYGWSREHGRHFGAELGVKVKWIAPDGKFTNHSIYLRQVPNIGWRVTMMR